jgi:hypothetical protein
MYRFWQTIYSKYIPILVAVSSAQTFTVDKEHFDRWMEIFTETVDILVQQLMEAKLRAKTWLRCSTTRSTILEIPTKRRSFKFKINPSCANYCF